MSEQHRNLAVPLENIQYTLERMEKSLAELVKLLEWIWENQRNG